MCILIKLDSIYYIKMVEKGSWLKSRYDFLPEIKDNKDNSKMQSW